jgi:hypothetical protein
MGTRKAIDSCGKRDYCGRARVRVLSIVARCLFRSGGGKGEHRTVGEGLGLFAFLVDLIWLLAQMIFRHRQMEAKGCLIITTHFWRT